MKKTLVVTLAARLFGALTLLCCFSAALAQQCPPAGCDDGNPCTDDLCDDTLGCRYFNNSAACTDGNACTTNDVCSGGVCVGGNTAQAQECTPCDSIAILPPQGGTFVGATSGAGALAGSCVSSLSAPERVYRWTAPSSGLATIYTCGSGTQYDSVVYLRSASCTGSQLSCNDDACATSNSPNHGSRITPTVTAGQTYYIVVDGYNALSGTYTLTVVPPANCGNGVREGAEACDGADNSGCVTGECTAQCTCVAPSSGLPDLRPEIVNWNIQFGASVAAGDVAEGCAESTSGVDLLRFGLRARNEGTQDLYFGNPGCPDCSISPLASCDNTNFICSPAAGHNHPHYSNYARYELLDPGSQTVVIGHKQGFCLLDSECANPQYSCGNQGISAGCADVYGSTLGCQYLDITGVPAGDYTLRATLDPFLRISELDEGNNVVSTAVTIPGPGVDACTSPTVIPAAGGVVTGSTSGSSTQSGTCATTNQAPEKVFQWTPSLSGTATIQTCGASGTSFDTVLYLRSGVCSTGSQVACNDDTSNCATSVNPGHGSRITPSVTAGQTYFIIVDGFGSTSGNFTLSVTPPAPPPPSACTNPTVIPAAGGVVTGSTSGSSTLSGTCATTNTAPEKVFQWTPSRSGTATIQTCSATGTNFNTVLYLRSGTCQTGSQIACNNNTDGCATTGSNKQGSRITPTVTAGQTYFIIVDGSGGARGNFTLSVTPPP